MVMQILNGNQILVKTAINLGANFFSGYPITPASTIMHEWVKQSAINKRLNFIQAEDELAAINIAIGASLAGSISFTATSGPGFSLMQESIGWAFAIEAPVVIVDVMRRGPSTGMPTIGAQGDILQTNFGSHGDYEIPVFYPSRLENIPYYTYQAFKTAELLKTPVVLLMDGYLSGLQKNVNETELINVGTISKGLKPLTQSSKTRYFTGLVTNENGDVRSYTIEDYKKWLLKRISKVEKLADNEFYTYIDRKSENLIITFGISGILCKQLAKENFNILILHQLFPVMKSVLEIIEKARKIAMCEINNGQYIWVLRAMINSKNIQFVKIDDIDISMDNILKQINGR